MNCCPCNPAKPYAECCGPFHLQNNAPTAVALMRSRYSAFCLGNIAYLDQTVRGKARLHFQPDATLSWTNSVHWLGLEIIQEYPHASDSTIAYVEFIARFMAKDKVQAIHELSEFHLIEGKWYYVDGSMPKNKHSPKVHTIAKNAPCPCNSKKKFKNCHGLEKT